MFQRLRGAIDRTIAEEQARQDSAASAPSRTASTSSRKNDGTAAKRPRPRKPASAAAAGETGEAALNPDPAVFEAAFVIDDSDDPSRAGTPKPQATPSKEKTLEEVTPNDVEPGNPEDKATESAEHKDGQATSKQEKTSNDTESVTNGAPNKPSDNDSPAAPTLTPEIRQRLRKLEKLEATYPELLRSYRVAHKRATAIEPFEKALRENTPLTSISDPAALTEYLNQLNVKSNMVMEELKRVSAEKDDLKKQQESSQEKLSKAEAEVEALKAGKPAEPTTDEAEKPKKSMGEKADASHEKKSSVSSVIGMFSPKQKAAAAETAKAKESGDLFSFDDEIPQLQADVASKAEEIERLQDEVETLKNELTVAKENSAGLVENLEKATRELSESREANSSGESLQTQLDARNEQIATLTERLEKSEAQLKQLEAKVEVDKQAAAAKVQGMETSLATSEKRASELDAAATKANQAREVSKKVIDDLKSKIASLENEKRDTQGKIDDLNKQLQSRPAATGATTPASQPTSTSGASKKKNKKKKGKGGAATTSPEADEAADETAASATPATSISDGTAKAAVESEISKLKEELSDKDAQIELLSKQRKTEEDLREEIEGLQENLVNIGQDHVEAKEKIKELEKEKVELKERIAELEKEKACSSASSAATSKLQGELDALQKEYEDLKEKSATLQSDLGAAQQLAQNRFKDLTDLREVLQKAQPELKSLRQESATLKTTKEELSSRTKELRDAERKEKELRRSYERAQQISSDREAEIRSLQEKLSAENTAKSRLEEAQRVSGRDQRRWEADKAEMSSRVEKMERELQRAQEEAARLRPRVKELEEQAAKAGRERTAAMEEADFKAQQYTNAQGLLGSMRDQTSEMSVQLKEARSQAESLEEELAEVQRLLQERTREGETMRRLLSDVDERADAKVRDMRTRMEAATEERDRIEDESSTAARRRAREAEELRGRIRELERETKTLSHERDELDQRAKDWRRRREELETEGEAAQAEATEARAAAAQLRSALDASEGQVRDAEKQRAELRRMLDEARARYERVAKDLKSAQGRLAVPSAASPSSRSSIDSNRSGTVNGSQAGGGGADTAYLKTILLQFLEQKDSKLRAQLVPVLGKLLKFDRAEEQKWMSAVQHM